ncbi:MAG: Spore coat polysaccharide biosynthesis protein SpsC [Parcubacteria group bacterium GW2011_GWA1_38_7]|nr:MAG: Spore coat polysaccharide biosynthesis protein SpsC [Parcubacteria group bacterium GW2011_GWA1_38_7]
MIPVLKPTIDEKTKKELLKVLDSGWWGFGPKTQEFEKKFAEYVGAKYCVATNSGTSALDLCLKVYNIKGGELITSAMTFVSDAIVGEWNGMDVTFADIDPDTLCLDPKTLVVTLKTKAIITIDSHGRLADVKGIRKKFKGLIIEDAAHAMYTPGAGKDADITIWSFQAVKSMPMWDGGAITTNDEAIYKKLRTLTWLGVEKSTYDRAVGKKYTWDYDITQSQGIKAYMTDMQAVVGLGQLRRLEKTNKRRRDIQAMYNKAFKNIPEIKVPEHSHTVQYYTMKCKNRNELSEFLAENGIATSVHFKPLSEMTYWKKAIKRPIPITDKVWVKLLSLPVHNALTDKEVKFIIKKVKEFYER